VCGVGRNGIALFPYIIIYYVKKKEKPGVGREILEILAKLSLKAHAEIRSNRDNYS
jgi:hypothetical protein